MNAFDYSQVAAKEDAAIKAVENFAQENAHLLQAIWSWGDGKGGALLEMLREHASIPAPVKYQPRGFVKQPIPAALRTQVFERDAYRCLVCTSHIDLCCDHIHPESKGGKTVLDNLQTLCRSCNSKKGARV